MKKFSLLVVAVLMAALATLVSAPSASAATLPANYHPNGCTMSPDRGWYPTYYDFKSACDSHDYCYDQMWYGGGEKGRQACDTYFFNRMSSWCNSYYSPWWASMNRAQCNGVAGIYYGAVRKFGAPYFNNPWKN